GSAETGQGLVVRTPSAWWDGGAGSGGGRGGGQGAEDWRADGDADRARVWHLAAGTRRRSRHVRGRRGSRQRARVGDRKGELDAGSDSARGGIRAVVEELCPRLTICATTSIGSTRCSSGSSTSAPASRV